MKRTTIVVIFTIVWLGAAGLLVAAGQIGAQMGIPEALAQGPTSTHCHT
jgi:hypothetical protein